VEADRAGKEYMDNIRQLKPERVAEEAATYAMYERHHGGGGSDDFDD
jgi:hypothetical protein